MTIYENQLGNKMIVVNEEYIIFDNEDTQLSVELYDETNFTKYIDSGFKLSNENEEKSLVGNCKCKRKIYENNRIKVRDYFECPSCGTISSRNDLIN